MMTEAIGILHPGEMGSAVAESLSSRGATVLWCPEDRSAASAVRATHAGVSPVDSLDELAARCSVILSVVPPHAALDVARALPPFSGIYIDANATSPTLSARIGEEVAARGATYVDGSLIGLPPNKQRKVRLYLAGESAQSTTRFFDGTQVEARPIPGDPYAASALKMAYAAWTKGTQALLVAIPELAKRTGVHSALLAEWADSQPALPEAADGAARQAAEKGWRWAPEMEQIALTFAGAGLPAGFHQAAAEIFTMGTGGSGLTPSNE